MVGVRESVWREEERGVGGGGGSGGERAIFNELAKMMPCQGCQSCAVSL